MQEKNRTVFKLALFILILVVCFILGRIIQFDINELRETINRYPVGYSGLVFVGLYVLATTLIWFGPKDVLRIASAIIFGGVKSTIFITIAEMFNTAILFHLSRLLGREYVEKKFKVKKKDVDHVHSHSDVFDVAVLTSNTFIPLRIQNLGFGLTQINFKKYFLIVICVLPLRIYWQQSILAVVGEAIFSDPLLVANKLSQHPQEFFFSFIYTFVMLVLTFVLIGKKIVERRKAKKEGN